MNQLEVQDRHSQDLHIQSGFYFLTAHREEQNIKIKLNQAQVEFHPQNFDEVKLLRECILFQEILEKLLDLERNEHLQLTATESSRERVLNLLPSPIEKVINFGTRVLNRILLLIKILSNNKLSFEGTIHAHERDILDFEGILAIFNSILDVIEQKNPENGELRTILESIGYSLQSLIRNRRNGIQTMRRMQKEWGVP